MVVPCSHKYNFHKIKQELESITLEYEQAVIDYKRRIIYTRDFLHTHLIEEQTYGQRSVKSFARRGKANL